MAITAPAAHSIGSSSWAGSITALANGIWIRLGLSATISHTSGNYRSIAVGGATIAGENLTLSGANFTGDCITGLTGVYQISGQTVWPANSTGYRSALIGLNPSATTVNSSTDLSYGTILAESTVDAYSDGDSVVAFPAFKIRLTSTDKIMLRGYQNAGSSLTIPTTQSKVWLELTKVAE